MLWCVVGWTVLSMFYGWVLDAVVCGGLDGPVYVLWVGVRCCGGLDGLAAVLWVGVRCCGVWWAVTTQACCMKID